MASNIKKANAVERTADRVAVGIRIPKEMQRRIRDYAAATDRSFSDAVEVLTEHGFLALAMAAGENSNLLVDLFVAVKSTHGALAMRVLDVLDRHLHWGELSTAIANVGRKHGIAV